VQAPGIVIVAIDELSFQEIGIQWPWPRNLHSALIGSLYNAGAHTIAFDLIFDRESPDPADDFFLIEIVREAGNVILAADCEKIMDQAYAVTQWIYPFPELEEAAQSTGVIRLPIDPDGSIRKVPMSFEGRPGFALAAALTREDFTPPQNLSKQRLISFNGPPREGIKTVSYYQALNPDDFLPEGIFSDKIVLVGLSLASAPELGEAADHYPTPVSRLMAGVEIHANLLDSILRNRFINNPFDSFTLTALICVVIALAMAPAFYRIGAFGGLLITLGASLVLFFGGFFLIAGLYFKIPVFHMIITIGSVFLFTYLYRFVLGITERRLILGAFKHYLAPAIVDRVLSDPSQLHLGGAKYEVTILFTDLAGFTTISEKLNPDQLQRLLTEYFDEMMEILSSENATLDKFIGDAIMVYFGCPVFDPEHPAQACRGAIKMQKRLVELNEKWNAQGIPEIKMRVGINTGEVVAGNMGTEKIFNFTILGDSVNLASRLEGVNKQYGSRTIISEFTRAHIGNLFELRDLDLIRVKGKKEPVAIYELSGFYGELPKGKESVFRLYEEGLNFYRQMQWDQAIAIFQRALSIDENDGPASTLLKRCYDYKKTPPPSNWEGIYTMQTK
jgi:adenylate cyclase